MEQKPKLESDPTVTELRRKWALELAMHTHGSNLPIKQVIEAAAAYTAYVAKGDIP